MRKILQKKEIIPAEKRIITYVRKESFAGLQDERIACLYPFLDEKEIIRLKTTIVEPMWETLRYQQVMPSPSSHSREARVEHTREVMPGWSTEAIESLAREVRDFERSEKRQVHSVKVCHVQKHEARHQRKPTSSA
jgi:hypothetical protein